ncbi:YbaK/EbsC family protein [Candidatus Woesearchaeota archaeon]|mgnify:CR=1 FL=1|nr:YbaK/EbsC family protein [Candidatus Woesearchaeota archaeon]
MSIAEKKIMKILKQNNIEVEVYEHEPVYTCEQAARVRGVAPNEGIKCLLLKSERGFVLAITRGDLRLNLKKLAKLENTKKLRFANEDEIEKIAECQKGCVHPFCNVKTYFDSILLSNETIEFNPGSHTKSVRIRIRDLLKLLNKPIIEHIS